MSVKAKLDVSDRLAHLFPVVQVVTDVGPVLRQHFVRPAPRAILRRCCQQPQSRRAKRTDGDLVWTRVATRPGYSSVPRWSVLDCARSSGTERNEGLRTYLPKAPLVSLNVGDMAAVVQCQQSRFGDAAYLSAKSKPARHTREPSKTTMWAPRITTDRAPLRTSKDPDVALLHPGRPFWVGLTNTDKHTIGPRGQSSANQSSDLYASNPGNLADPVPRSTKSGTFPFNVRSSFLNLIDRFYLSEVPSFYFHPSSLSHAGARFRFYSSSLFFFFLYIL